MTNGTAYKNKKRYNMIIKLEFDMFYTIIKTPDIAEKELRKGLYNEFERWLKKQQCYAVKKVLYDDDAVIKWLKETKFQDDKIEVLEKHKWTDEKSSYDIDAVLNF
ncbi:hypothetical protein [uncultured Eubacterium sp.]|uniref:hypothetical protein n=2 Tax=uncultured Eubacterium sp. TaxID=165185 RepID=UPI0025D1EE25|nr:hypothetical protein [uncultured Eubacterium sp.]